MREKWMDVVGYRVDGKVGWVVVWSGWMMMEVDSQRGVDG